MATQMQFRVCILLLAVAVYVYCEQCTVNSDCTSTGCASGYHTICVHPNPADGITTNGGTCTCALDNYTCSTRNDCLTVAMNCISDDHRHCYDGRCICTNW